MHSPLLIAHRGNTSDFPENTMEAFASAFEKGADGIELDVHLNSRNQVIVVHHYTHDPNGNYPLLSEVLVSALKKAGYVTHSHLKTKSQKDWDTVIRIGIDQCTFDDIELLKYKHSN